MHSSPILQASTSAEHLHLDPSQKEPSNLPAQEVKDPHLQMPESHTSFGPQITLLHVTTEYINCKIMLDILIKTLFSNTLLFTFLFTSY